MMDKNEESRYPLHEWRLLEEMYLRSGDSRRTAHQKIAEGYGLSRTTIYAYLTPGQSEGMAFPRVPFGEEKEMLTTMACAEH